MTTNEVKLIRGALKGFVDNGLISETTMQEITSVKQSDGKAVRPDLVTRPEAIKILGVCQQSLINYEKEGLLPAIKIAGKRMVRYKLSDIEALCK